MADPLYQTRPYPPYPSDVTAFADALEEIMADGTWEPAAIAAGLQRRGVVLAGSGAWTAERLKAALTVLAGA